MFHGVNGVLNCVVAWYLNENRQFFTNTRVNAPFTAQSPQQTTLHTSNTSMTSSHTPTPITITPLVLYLLLLLLLLIQKCTQNALYPKRDMVVFVLPLGFKTLRWTVFSIALRYASHPLPLKWRLTKGRLGCPVRLQLSTFWLWKSETLM